jgi:hypothetical protein
MLTITALLAVTFASLVASVNIPLPTDSNQLPLDRTAVKAHCTLGFDETCAEGYICASFGPRDEPHCVEQGRDAWGGPGF